MGNFSRIPAAAEAKRRAQPAAPALKASLASAAFRFARLCGDTELLPSTSSRTGMFLSKAPTQKLQVPHAQSFSVAADFEFDLE
mmetsp:Transcript_17206/g.34052  ORF Transcript_17206/g.34052 Transcript_17206/m.34052 type:complete len:84 (-) Transcript_17206:1734-1985(-)